MSKKHKKFRKEHVLAAAVATGLALAAGATASYTANHHQVISPTVQGLYAPPAPTKTSGCVIAQALPDAACTPGAVIKTATKAKVCVSGYAKTVRNVPESEKNTVYAEYGIASHTTGQYEVDHLISLELGGANDTANLWPEAANPTPGFHQKDVLENQLHKQVCDGTISLAEAQKEIATDWLKYYKPK
jgi:hypothetical protein